MIYFNENGNPSTFGKSQNFESQTASHIGKKRQFNERSKQNFKEYNKPFRIGNNALFNKGNNKAVNWQNTNERRQNFKGPKNFNSRSLNNANRQTNFNQRSNAKPWQGNKFQFSELNSSLNKCRTFDDIVEEQVNDRSSNGENQQTTFKQENIATDVTTSESSDTENEIMIQNNDITGDSETSESEDELVPNIKKEEVETSETEEDELVPNIKKEEVETSETEEDEPVPIVKTEVEIIEIDCDDEPEPVIKTEVVETSESEEIELHANDEMETSSNEDESQTEDDSKGAEEVQKIAKNKEAGVKTIEYQNSNRNSERDKTNLLGTGADSTVTREMNDREILVRNIPSVVEEEHLEKFFSKFGKIHTLKMTSWWNSEKFGRTSKVCSIVFENVEDAHKALEVNGMEYQQHYLEVCLSANKCPDELDKEIFVRGLPHDVSINDVWRAFETCGIIKKIWIARLRHIASVCFESTNHVELALAKDIYINGRKVDVERYRSKDTRTSMESQKSLTVHTQPGANIQIYRNELDNSVTITFGNKVFSGPKFHQKAQGHKVRSGFIRKKR